jgi:hypothetical protein
LEVGRTFERGDARLELVGLLCVLVLVFERVAQVAGAVLVLLQGVEAMARKAQAVLSRCVEDLIRPDARSQARLALGSLVSSPAPSSAAPNA